MVSKPTRFRRLFTSVKTLQGQDLKAKKLTKNASLDQYNFIASLTQFGNPIATEYSASPKPRINRVVSGRVGIN